MAEDDIKDAGRWQDGSAHSRSYSSAPHGGLTAVMHGFPGTAQEAVHNHITGQAALIPSDAVLQLLMPRVLALHDMPVLDVISACKYAEKRKRELRHDVPLCNLLEVIKACAVAMAQVCFQFNMHLPHCHHSN